MIGFKRYFIVGTNDSCLHDTMNGAVTGELIRSMDCKWYYRGGATCMYWDGENGMRGDDYCSQAERKEE